MKLISKSLCLVLVMQLGAGSAFAQVPAANLGERVTELDRDITDSGLTVRDSAGNRSIVSIIEAAVVSGDPQIELQVETGDPAAPTLGLRVRRSSTGVGGFTAHIALYDQNFETRYAMTSLNFREGGDPTEQRLRMEQAIQTLSAQAVARMEVGRSASTERSVRGIELTADPAGATQRLNRQINSAVMVVTGIAILALAAYIFRMAPQPQPQPTATQNFSFHFLFMPLGWFNRHLNVPSLSSEPTATSAMARHYQLVSALLGGIGLTVISMGVYELYRSDSAPTLRPVRR